jgi:transcription elongation factor Elf1
MSEEQVKPNEQEVKKLSKTDLMAALEHEFATSVNRIYVNSVGREIGFREITVQEQKTLSRIMIDNEKRKDIVFDAQCALINKACLEQGSFDVYKCSEFDRLKLLIALYQANMYKNDVKFTCPHCGTENQYKLDFDNVLKKLDKIELKDEEFSYENKNWAYKF